MIPARSNDPQKIVLKILLFSAVFFCIDYLGSNILLNGLYRYYRFDGKAKVLCVGHSHAKLGIDEKILGQGVRGGVVKFAIPGTNIYEHLAMVKLFFNKYPESKAVVVYDVHSYTFSHHKISDNSRVLFYPYMDDPDVASYLNNVAPSWQEYYSRKIIRLLRFNNHELLTIALRGYFGKEDDSSYNRTRKTLEEFKKPPPASRKISIDPAEVACFHNTMNFLRQKNKRIVLLAIPTIDYLNDAEHPMHDKVMEIFREVAANDTGISFFNYNPRYENKIEMFEDSVHLHRGGRIAVTNDLVVDLNKMSIQ